MAGAVDVPPGSAARSKVVFEEVDVMSIMSRWVTLSVAGVGILLAASCAQEGPGGVPDASSSGTGGAQAPGTGGAQAPGTGGAITSSGGATGSGGSVVVGSGGRGSGGM